MLAKDLFTDDIAEMVDRWVKGMGLTELATVRLDEEDRHRPRVRVVIATDAGIAIGELGPSAMLDPGLTADVTPWTDVTGARMVSAYFPQAAQPDPLLTIHIENPAFNQTSRGGADSQGFKALRDFGLKAMKHQAGWTKRVKPTD